MMLSLKIGKGLIMEFEQDSKIFYLLVPFMLFVILMKLSF